MVSFFFFLKWLPSIRIRKWEAKMAIPVLHIHEKKV